MHKLKTSIAMLAPALVAGVASAAEGDIDVTKVSEAGTKVTTALTSYFNDTLIPLVITIGGLALVVFLVAAVFRWARKLAK